MNQTKSEAKNVIGRAVTDCQQTWPLTQQDLLEILISLAGDIATGQRLLTPVAADAATVAVQQEEIQNNLYNCKCVVVETPRR